VIIALILVGLSVPQTSSEAEIAHAPDIRGGIRHGNHHLSCIRLVIILIVVLEHLIVATLLLHHVEHLLHLLVLGLQILYRLLLLSVLLHEDLDFIIKCVIDGNVLLGLGISLLLSILREEITLDLHEDIIASILNLALEVIVPLLQLYNVSILHLQTT
jgi:hypothetical protein